MVWSEIAKKAASYGLSVENAFVDGMFLAGMQIATFGGEFVKSFGEGSRGILLRAIDSQNFWAIFLGGCFIWVIFGVNGVLVWVFSPSLFVFLFYFLRLKPSSH